MVQVLPPQPVTNLFRTVCKVLPGKGIQPHKFRTSCWDNKENVDGVRVPRESPAVLVAAPPYGVSDHTVCGIQTRPRSFPLCTNRRSNRPLGDLRTIPHDLRSSSLYATVNVQCRYYSQIFLSEDLLPLGHQENLRIFRCNFSGIKNDKPECLTALRTCQIFDDVVYSTKKWKPTVNLTKF